MKLKRTVEFSRTPDGGWLFKWGHATFKAWRNEAGFAHRDWELHHLESEKQYGPEAWTIVEDMLSSRTECVDVAAATSLALAQNPKGTDAKV